MPFNGSGVFSRVYNWVNDKNNSIDITASRMDTEDDGFATGLSNCITKNGQTSITNDLPMSGFHHTSVSDASARNQYSSAGQIQDSGLTWCGLATGTANAITLTPSPAITTLTAGQSFQFISSAANSTAVTIAISGLTAKAATKNGATALAANDIPSGAIIDIQYDGTQYQVLNISPINLSASATVPTATANTSALTIANMAAVQNSMIGGFINKFRNATMDTWSRGTSGTATVGGTNYSADGWRIDCTGANVAWAQTAGRASTTYALKITGAASVTDVIVKQRIESFLAASLYPNATAQITIAAKIYNNTGGSITPTITIRHATGGVDNWSSGTTDISAVSLQACPNTTLTTVAYTFASVSGTTNGLEAQIDFGNNFSSNAKSVEVTEFDIRVTPGVTTGLNSAPPVPELRPIAVESLINLRYLPVFGDIVGVIGTGLSSSTTASGYYIPFRVPTRVIPTGLTITTVGDFEVATYAGADVAALTAMTFNSTYSSNQGAHVTTTVASGLTSATPYMLDVKTALAGNLIFTGSEL